MALSTASASGEAATVYRSARSWAPSGVTTSSSRILVLEAEQDRLHRSNRVRVVEVRNDEAIVAATPEPRAARPGAANSGSPVAIRTVSPSPSRRPPCPFSPPSHGESCASAREFPLGVTAVTRIEWRQTYSGASYVGTRDTVMSMPFIDEEFTFTQPDGSTLQVRGTGDQHRAHFETFDGFTVIQDPVSRFYHYARPSEFGAGLVSAGIRAGAANPALLGLERTVRPQGLGLSTTENPGIPRVRSRWEERRQERRHAVQLAQVSSGLLLAPPERPTVGQFVGLTLLIDFVDQPATITREEVEAFCNQSSYSGFGNSGSVRDYFFDISDGNLEYTNVVLPYYRARQPRTYYTNENVASPIRAREMILEALSHHVANGLDASVLTSDERDYVYALNVFYAGRRSNNWAQGLWPHASRLPIPRQLGPAKFAADYQITDMASSVAEELTLGTFCHENGHMICDFPDLYDYGYESSGAGKFCLMCSGGSKPREKNPTQVGAYLKHAAGWTSRSVDVQPGDAVSLTAGRNEFALYRKNETEYFMIENRAASGRDSMLGANGLAVWHIDELGSNNDEAGTPTLHYECALIQADGLMQLERKRYYDGDDKDLFKAGHRDELSEGTTPNSNWWDRTGSGLHIRQISAAGPAMNFAVV